jgi:hypothetical protein
MGKRRATAKQSTWFDQSLDEDMTNKKSGKRESA